MSSCVMMYINNGVPTKHVEFRNSWLGAAAIWDAMYNKYLKDPAVEYDSWLSSFSKDKGQGLWDLYKNPTLEECEVVVHMSTFDRAYVKHENYPRFIADLRKFASLHGIAEHYHLHTWAKHLETCEAEAIGFHHTTVSDNPWYRREVDADESIPYSIDSEDCFEVYTIVDEKLVF